MQRRSAALHGTLGSHLRDALQEGSADAVACMPPWPVARTSVCGALIPPYFFLVIPYWWFPLPFLVRNDNIIISRPG
jgi:hypothetical protein